MRTPEERDRWKYTDKRKKSGGFEIQQISFLMKRKHLIRALEKHREQRDCGIKVDVPDFHVRLSPGGCSSPPPSHHRRHQGINVY